MGVGTTPDISNPILNTPYSAPERHFEIGPNGPTGTILDGRRPSESFVPIPAARKGKSTDQQAQWALEREAGNWGIGLADRILRFIGVSALFLSVLAYPTYRVWLSYLHNPGIRPGRYTNLLVEGYLVPWWLWLLPVAYVAAPIALGTVSGLSVNSWPRLSRVLVGRDPAPRAWDFVFSPRPTGVVRIEFKDGRFAGGLFAYDSYAAGYPEEPQDIYLERLYRVLEDGAFAAGDAEGGYEEIGSGALIRWDEIKMLEFLHDEEEEENPDG